MSPENALSGVTAQSVEVFLSCARVGAIVCYSLAINPNQTDDSLSHSILFFSLIMFSRLLSSCTSTSSLRPSTQNVSRTRLSSACGDQNYFSSFSLNFDPTSLCHHTDKKVTVATRLHLYINPVLYITTSPPYRRSPTFILSTYSIDYLPPPQPLTSQRIPTHGPSSLTTAFTTDNGSFPGPRRAHRSSSSIRWSLFFFLPVNYRRQTLPRYWQTRMIPGRWHESSVTSEKDAQ